MGVRTNDEAGADDRGAAAPLAEGAASAAGSAGATEPAAAPEPGAEDRAAGNAEGRDATDSAAPDAEGRDATEPSAAPDANGQTGSHHKRTAPDVGAAVAAALAEAVHPRPGRPAVGDQSGIEARPGETGHAPDASPDHRTAQPPAPGKVPSRRPPSLTRDTARPEGGGRAAPGGAPAPARQWPLLTVLALTGLGLVVVGTDAFADAFRVGTILIGVALLTGAVLRRMLPSVGMLAVRSRFTDMVTYGVLGILIVLLALVTQPKPWLDVPFLEDAVHFTVR
ncbi:DUF3017 domain-containing protein [Streptomyces sp. NPDC019443]|uniref:DUF3017 domain-containing protein n=1 Tax=Streptomyces sp. NPDC019443 TaxID=3365061 RepID=UPI003795C07A